MGVGVGNNVSSGELLLIHVVVNWKKTINVNLFTVMDKFCICVYFAVSKCFTD